MSKYNTDGPSDNEWEERGELVWNEFDWERYLRDQDEVVIRYVAFYDKSRDKTDRIDEVAKLMGWTHGEWSSEGLGEDDDQEDATALAEAEEAEPYTLHKNPIYVATRAIFLGLKRIWGKIAEEPTQVPQALAVQHCLALQRAEDQAQLAIQALDFGDYALAISLFKRALRELNLTFAQLTALPASASSALQHYRDNALPCLFDLREIWLRVMTECREELEQPLDDDDEDE